MLSLSQRSENVAPSETLAITAKINSMQAQGIDVIKFAAGEPDFDTPEYIKDAAIESLRNGFTKYTPVPGIAALREAIVEKFKRDNNLHYSPSQIIVSCGAKHSIYNILQAICNPGDEVVFAAPYWVSYPEIVKLSDAKPIVVETTAGQNFCMKPEQIESVLSDRTKAIIISSPSNPTGTVYDAATLSQIGELALERQCYVISDEIYESLLYDDLRHQSIASLDEAVQGITFVVNGVSKAYSMTGWRIGYTAGPEKAVQAMSRIQSHSTSNPTSIAQIGALTALTASQEAVEEMRRAFEERRNVICQRFDEIDGITYAKPQGAFYIFPDVSSHYGRNINGKTVNGSVEMTAFLLDSARVGVIPGNASGADNHLRLSFATSLAEINSGMDRIKEALA
ncbi:MAG: pyridoxal phosphate-dependent aminotransferase [Candidatus Poribacteria bacterium]|nr:pyridoxal phosphate-dependent aminotransferase [Candidatus Poribacteria bacterium]MDE0502873.1 pyridoxal phosphate-dependent aminotransferase [Candidatus Poribacteria bacterium]